VIDAIKNYAESFLPYYGSVFGSGD
jgi:hypothetical protein